MTVAQIVFIVVCLAANIAGLFGIFRWMERSPDTESWPIGIGVAAYLVLCTITAFIIVTVGPAL